MVTSESRALREKIVRGELDPNNSSLFFAEAIKASILFLNEHIKLRNKRVPHFIINTGDDILYRELMDYSYSRLDVTDENFVYNEIPRGVVTINDINTLPDQLTQPYVRSFFEITSEDGQLYEFSAETRRMPLQSTINIKYYLDSFTDCLSLSQYLITTLCYIRTFQFDYMGNTVLCSLKFPDAFSTEIPSTITFDSESKYKSISIDLTLETNIPIFDGRTAIESDAMITTSISNINRLHNNQDYNNSIRSSAHTTYKYRTSEIGWIYWFDTEDIQKRDIEKKFSGTLLFTIQKGQYQAVKDGTYKIENKKYKVEGGYVIDII